MRERSLFSVLFAAVVAGILMSGCGSDVSFEDIPDSDAEFAAAHPDGNGATVVPPVRTVWDRDTTSASPKPAPHDTPASLKVVEIPEWSLPNGRYHNVVFIDISGSLSESDRSAAADIAAHRIKNVRGSNKITVYLVGTSYVRWPTAATDAERDTLAASVQDYLATHNFVYDRKAVAYTNYALPLLDAMEDGFRELKESGTRFHATIVGDGWNQEPEGQDSWFFKEALYACMSRVPPERKRMFRVELISVNTRTRQYTDELHLRDLFSDPDFPVYPAGNWSDVSKRFEELDRELAGSYSWTNVTGVTVVPMSDFDEQYLAGVYSLSLSAPSWESGERFSAELSAASEHSVLASHLSGYWRIHGDKGNPVPMSEGLVISDGVSVEIYVGGNEESPPPTDVFWPLRTEVPFEVKLVPHSAVSLAELGSRPEITATWRAWMYRNWIPDKLVGIFAITVCLAVLLRLMVKRMECIWGAPLASSDPLQDAGDIVGYISCDGAVDPIRHTWFQRRNIDVVPTPDGIFIRPHVLCSMYPLAGADVDQVSMKPGTLYPLIGGAVEIRDASNIVYQVRARAVLPAPVAALGAHVDQSIHEVEQQEVYV